MISACTIGVIVPTLGHAHDLERLIHSLEQQALPPDEVCVVDQSDGSTTLPAIARAASSLPIVHVFDSERGASRARNVGIASTASDILAFPDDDMWYPPDALQRVAAAFASEPSRSVVAGRFADPQGRTARLRFSQTPLELNRQSVWRNAMEACTFIRRDVFAKVGGFDMSVGAGAGTKWGSGEITDLLLRAHGVGAGLFYDPGLAVHGPLAAPGGIAELRRVRAYGRGIGMLYRRHGFPRLAVALCVTRPIGAAAIDLGRGRPWNCVRHLSAALGRLAGVAGRIPPPRTEIMTPVPGPWVEAADA